jgi:transglutaminase-like putative cysteine protease
MNFLVGCRLRYELSGPGTIIFNVQAVNSQNQQVLNEELSLPPHTVSDEWIDPVAGNRFLRVNAQAGPLELVYSATVKNAPQIADESTISEIAPADLPLSIVPFLYPSRYCESDRLVRLALGEFGDLAPGFARVTAVCNYIYETIAYERGSSGSQTSAFDTITERAGVCRDFAHLGIALCRALGIPARFATGYAYGLNPPDFHACFEAFLSDGNTGRWYFFDATRQAPQTGYVRIGSGRDAADVSFATLFGPVNFDSMEITMQSQGFAPQFTTQAVALA